MFPEIAVSLARILKTKGDQQQYNWAGFQVVTRWR